MTPEALIIESLFRIANKDGLDVDFKLNSAQREVDEGLTGHDVIPKARQEGISSYYLARSLAKCLMYRNNRSVVISHDTVSTQKMLSKVHYMIDNIKGPQPIIGTSSKNEITFPKMGSAFYIGTAGQKKFGRGDTINTLHCSEVAYWDNAGDTMTGLLNAVPLMSGEVSMESTGNGKGNYYHNMCMRAYKGGGRYKMHFLPWHTFEEYDLPVTVQEADEIMASLDPEFEEIKLVQEAGLTAGQIKFRRLNLEEVDYDVTRFKQEYPMTLNECFQATGHGIFNTYNLVIDSDWKRQEDRRIWALQNVWNAPLSKYILAIDVGGGVGKDDSVIDVFDLITMEQVAQFISDRVDPTYLGVIAKQIGLRFNEAFIICESNNHGIATLAQLKSTYKRSLLYRDKQDSDNIIRFGYRTNQKNKPLFIAELRRDVKEDIIIHSPVTADQLDTFVETDTGQLEAEGGAKDDAVISLAMANIGKARGAMMTGARGVIAKTKINPKAAANSVDGAIESILENKREEEYREKNILSFPIAEQVEI